jgi:hypothetical protein
MLPTKYTFSRNNGCNNPVSLAPKEWCLYTRFQYMKPVGKVGVSLLSLLLFATPIMACTMQANAMTAAERDCCKRMAQECGKGKMSQSHSCCKTVAMPDHLPAIKSSSDFNSAHQVLLLAHVLPQISVAMPLVEFAPAVWASDMHGPPGSPPVTISVLRI